MLQSPLCVEGTWEQISSLGQSLSGYRLRLTVLGKEDVDTTNNLSEPAQSLSAAFAAIRAENSEEWDALPNDLAEQHDHYIYGWPKK